MPSPLGHGLGGLAAGWAVAGPAEDRRALWTQTLLFMALGAAPDLDLLTRHHRYETHSVGAAVIAGAIAALVRLPVARTRGRIFWAATAAWATHPLMDMLAPDRWPPIGVEAFWPFSRGFYITGLNIFLPVARNLYSWSTWTHDARAAVRETLVLVPIVALVWWIRTRTSRSLVRSSGPGDPRRPSA
jgi:membrane-bound metal-dependent hydrolase YbcI (DUF457 family)